MCSYCGDVNGIALLNWFPRRRRVSLPYTPGLLAAGYNPDSYREVAPNGAEYKVFGNSEKLRVGTGLLKMALKK